MSFQPLTSSEAAFGLSKLMLHVPAFLEKRIEVGGYGISRAIALGLFIGYLSFVRMFRWRNYYAIHSKYQDRYDSKTKKWDLTPSEAQEIVMLYSGLDMPKVHNLALASGMFKTYAMPSISKLLYATRELSTKPKAAKRFADAEILITTFVACPITGFWDVNKQADGETPAQDSRAMLALSRVNYIHSRYPTIKNDDLLYNIGVFVMDSIDLCYKFGWRSLSPMEREATYIYWAEIARRMNIQGIPESLDELLAWTDAYEEEHMLPVKTNHAISKNTCDEFTASVPEFMGLRNFVFRILVAASFSERERIAMMFEAQPWYIHGIVKTASFVIAYVQRYLMFPRSVPSYPIEATMMKDPSANLYPKVTRSTPWYRQERKGLGYLMDRVLVAIGYMREMPAKHWLSEGYRLESAGPVKYLHSGIEETIKGAEKLQGCPIKF